MPELKTPEGPPATSPRDALLQIVNTYMLSQCVYVAAKLGVADLLRDGPKSYHDLAAATEAHAFSLYRVLRCLASNGIFREDDDGRFSLNEMAELLRSDVADSARGWTVIRGESFLWQPWGQIMHCVKTGQSGFINAFGKDWPEYFGQNPEASALFNDGMRSISAQKYTAAARAYDFSAVNMIVDVGGGNGGLLTAILTSNPHMKGILAERPHVIGEAQEQLDAVGLGSRCECVAVNMFDGVPDRGDAYIMANVVHDWDDERSIKLLRNCRQVMQPNGKVLLVEMVISPRNEPHLSKLLDIEMLVMTDGGKERSENEYQALYKAAGLQLTRVIPTESPWSVLEGVAV